MVSRSKSPLVLVCGALIAFQYSSVQLSAGDWPQFRGPNLTGSAVETQVFSADGVGLELAWKRELGSGYSSISVVGDRAVTMYVDGNADVVAAFDAATGDKIWEYRVGSHYEGHSGSDDGPAGTPAIDDGRVFGLGRVGHLFAVSLEDGSELWSRDLKLGSEATLPHYGFATTPLVVGDIVVVQTGAPEGRAISAYDTKSGQPRWSVDDDTVNYQSPAIIELGSLVQIVALNNKFLIGIDPADGEVLWRYDHETNPAEAFNLPLALGDDRILINSLSEVVAIKINREGDEFSTSEIWRSNVFRSSYSIPVAENGYLYGFSGRFLSCVDGATGEVMWKSRPPGGKGLILVDGHLVINGKDGDLVIVEASPEGYEEVARLGLFERGSYTSASFAGGQIFVRDLDEIAAVRITETSSPIEGIAEQGLERELMGEFGKWVVEVEAADNKDALVETFFAQHETFPVIEDGSLVHFIYRGEVDDIALAGTFLGFGEQISMDRIAGTEVYFRSLRLDPKTNWEYYFDVNLGTPSADPGNPNSIGTFFGPGSELRMPEWSIPDFLAEVQDETAEIPKGRVDSFEFRSDARDNTRRIQIYLPAGYAAGTDRYRLLVMHYGGFALNAAGIDRVLDSLIAGHTTAPFIAVLLPQGSLEEGGGGASGEYVQFLTDELIPFMDRNYRTVTDPGSRATMGIFDGGTLSVYSALKAPEVFGKAAAQSLYLKLPVAEEIYELMEARKGDSLEFYVRWTPNDLVLTNGGIDCAADSKRLSEMLSESGFQVDGDEVDGSWGWGTWRAQYGPILEAMFPPQSAEEG